MDEQTTAGTPGATPSDRDTSSMTIRLPTLNRLLRQLLPDETVNHMYAAQREQLLAIRSLVDAAIENVEKLERDDTPKRKQRIEIAVE